jgi:hypothetical protein
MRLLSLPTVKLVIAALQRKSACPLRKSRLRGGQTLATMDRPQAFDIAEINSTPQRRN